MGQLSGVSLDFGFILHFGLAFCLFVCFLIVILPVCFTFIFVYFCLFVVFLFFPLFFWKEKSRESHNSGQSASSDWEGHCRRVCDEAVAVQ